MIKPYTIININMYIGRSLFFLSFFIVSIVIINSININKFRRACALALQVLEFSIVPSTISSAATTREEVHPTLSIPCTNYFPSVGRLVSFENVHLIGSGGGGTVFSGKLSNFDEFSVLKVSNLMSIKSVESECSILLFLESKMKSSNYYSTSPLKIEKCLASCSPPAVGSTASSNAASITLKVLSTSNNRPSTIPDSKDDHFSSATNYNDAMGAIFQSEPTSRQVILLSPLFQVDSQRIKNELGHPISSKALSTLSAVWEISHENAKIALQSLAHTVIGMILLGVANSDVQVLINPYSGDCLLIDLTEARVMDNSHPTSFDVQLARNFVSEFSSLMMLPDNDGVLRNSEVNEAIRREIDDARLHFEGYADIPAAIKELLEDLYEQ